MCALQAYIALQQKMLRRQDSSRFRNDVRDTILMSRDPV